ncbi:endonuclease [Paenibacillus sp. J2TS4]|nr:endonuclease [Paenibacillus sp. J2TS4]
MPNIKLEDLRASGIDCIELAWRNDVFDMLEPGNQNRCAELIRQARGLGIQVWSLHLPYGTEWDVSAVDERHREAAIARHLQLMHLAAEWKIGTVILHPSWEPIPDAERNERLQACRRSLARMAAEAERFNLRVAVECLPRTCLGNTSEEMGELLEADERLGVCCDVNHLLQEAPEQYIRKIGSRILTVHMSDNDGLDEKHGYPGEGVIRWNDVISALLECGYQGPFMFEVRPVNPDRLGQCWSRLMSAYSKNEY